MRIRGKNTVCWAGLGCEYFRIGKIQSKRVEKKILHSNNNLNGFVSLEKDTESCVKKEL